MTTSDIQAENTVKRLSWTDLNSEQKNGVLALTLSHSVNDAARKFKVFTGRSRAYFYQKIYSVIKDDWKSMTEGLPNDALRILQGGSLAAATELVDEISHRDVKIRNKASNDILDKVIAKQTKTTGLSVKDGDKEIRVIVEDWI